jgi:LAGLIDADG-like domain
MQDMIREIERAPFPCLLAYLHGALGDATFSPRHRTVRYGQADRRWLVVLQAILARLGAAGWIYREGSTRPFWVLETTAPFIDFEKQPEAFVDAGALDYVRGFFDAEGGMPASIKGRLYLQFAQRDLPRIRGVHRLLVSDGMSCGKIHNPSQRADPDYWRFYVRANSHERFLRLVGSWHPRKRPLVDARLGRCSSLPNSLTRVDGR